MKKILVLFQAFQKNGFISKIPHLGRMIKAARSGEYKMKTSSILVPAIAILYFISPINLSFELIPFLGQLDDLAILAFVIPLLVEEVDRFLVWEKQHNSLNSNIEDAKIVK